MTAWKVNDDLEPSKENICYLIAKTEIYPGIHYTPTATCQYQTIDPVINPLSKYNKIKTDSHTYLLHHRACFFFLSPNITRIHVIQLLSTIAEINTLIWKCKHKTRARNYWWPHYGDSLRIIYAWMGGASYLPYLVKFAAVRCTASNFFESIAVLSLLQYCHRENHQFIQTVGIFSIEKLQNYD